jgi:SnoaL-like domain
MDELEVLDLINRYGATMDSAQWQRFEELFTPDVEADYGDPLIFSGLEAFQSGAEMAWGSFDATQHSMSNTICELRGDVARTLTYGTWHLLRRGTPGGDVWEGKGWYDDAIVRTDTGWRVNRRVCRVAFWSGNAAVAGYEPEQIPTYSLRDEVRKGAVGFYADW